MRLVDAALPLTYRGAMPRLASLSLVSLVLLVAPVARAQEAEAPSTDEARASDTPASDAPASDAPAFEMPAVGDALTFETADGRFRVQPLAHVQTLLFISQDLEANGAASAGFMVRRARIGLDGHLFTKDLRFQVEGNWDQGQPALQDAIIEYELTPLVVLQAGQFKRPFSRDFLASSSESLTFERVLPHDRFFIGRDIGVMLHNNFDKSPGLEYAVGVFNGTGDAVFFRRPLPSFDVTHVPGLFHPAFVGRVGVNVGDMDGYREGDLEGGPLRFAVASSVALDSPTRFNPGLASAEVDFALKAYGAWATGAVFLESGPLDGSGGDGQLGLHLEGSYTLGGSLLPVLAYGMVAPLGGNTARHEVTAGAAVLVLGNHFRLMTDAVLGVDQAPGAITTDVSVRAGLALTL